MQQVADDHRTAWRTSTDYSFLTMTFQIIDTEPGCEARRGVLETAHGVVATPAFMPCASRAVVRACTCEQLAAVGLQMLICNAYHLLLRPGPEVIAAAGGLHQFMGWQGPLATDSGGYQVFSLSQRAQITEQGVQFRSEVDGSEIFLAPEDAVRLQNQLGADLIMCLDECTPYPCEHEYARASMEMTLRWARRCRQAHHDDSQALFGIVQGSVYHDLRARSARETVAIGFDGYAIGGLSVGESRREMFEALETSLQYLPLDKPRYAMGVGTPLDIIECVQRGVDIFDCVLPTRNARHGSVLTWGGSIKINNARYRDDFRPLEADCKCPACTHHTRAYLHHLFRINEATAWTLLSLHNLHFYARLMERIRQAIGSGELQKLQRELHTWTQRDEQ